MANLTREQLAQAVYLQRTHSTNEIAEIFGVRPEELNEQVENYKNPKPEPVVEVKPKPKKKKATTKRSG